jgi:predicted porin
MGTLRVLLTASAILAAPAAAPAAAAEVRSGGALDVTISGYVAFQAHAGDLNNQRLDDNFARGLDFSTETEVHVIVRGKHDATGIEYGGTVEFDADTNDTENASGWVFVRGGFGELRLGDEEGPVEESALGAQTVAAGTGGIDGEVVDELVVDAVLPTNTDVRTKIRYYTPSFAGFQLALSYAPDAEDRGDTLARRGAEVGDWVEGALVYEGELAEDVELEASLVGSRGEVQDRDEFAGGRDLWTYFAGFAAEVGDLELGAGFGDEDVGGLEKRYVNLGIAYELDEVAVSLTHGRVLRTRGYEGVGEPWNLVLSADMALLPGLVLAGDLAYFDNDLDPEEAEDFTGDDSGWVWVTRLEVEF